MIRVDSSGRYRFNFLEYEMQREGIAPDVLASNVVSTLQTIIEVENRAKGLLPARESTFTKTPLWRAVLRLETDALVRPETRH